MSYTKLYYIKINGYITFCMDNQIFEKVYYLKI